MSVSEERSESRRNIGELCEYCAWIDFDWLSSQDVWAEDSSESESELELPNKEPQYEGSEKEQGNSCNDSVEGRVGRRVWSQVRGVKQIYIRVT